MALAKDKCEGCERLGYFKLGLCIRCRTTLCPDCGKTLRKSYLGQKRCSNCERKWQAKVNARGGG
jgi:hypothetical protein